MKAIANPAHASCPVVIVPDKVSGELLSGPIVWGFDGSTESGLAGRFAFEQAHLSGEPVQALSTWEISAWEALAAARSGTDIGPDPAHSQEQVDSAIAALKSDYPDVEAAGTVVRGNAPTTLASASQNASLVAVGSRGLGGFSGLLLGSVSRALVYLADCPVAIIR